LRIYEFSIRRRINITRHGEQKQQKQNKTLQIKIQNKIQIKIQIKIQKQRKKNAKDLKQEQNTFIFAEVRQIIWERDNTSQGFDYLWLTKVRSRLKCSVTCTDDERCSAFFFDESAKSCLAYQYPLESIMGTVPPENRYYYYFKPG
jgi:hypothetical protein